MIISFNIVIYVCLVTIRKAVEMFKVAKKKSELLELVNTGNRIRVS